MSSVHERRSPPGAAPSTGRPPDTGDVCVICEAPTGRDGITVCSRGCLRQARRELEANARDVKDPRLSDGRDDLVSRNGVLTEALISWSPE
jgi:hypothetical protein